MPAATTRPTASPRAVFEQLLATITRRGWADLPDLYAEDVVVEQPFQLPEPLRLAGRAQVRSHFAAAANLPVELAARDVVVHDTLDPEVVVGEFDYDVHVPASGRRFRVANVIVLRVRNGQIVASRDYHNHAALADALLTYRPPGPTRLSSSSRPSPEARPNLPADLIRTAPQRRGGGIPCRKRL